MPHISKEELKSLKQINKINKTALNVLEKYISQLEKALDKNNLSIDGSVKNQSQNNGDNKNINVENCKNLEIH